MIGFAFLLGQTPSICCTCPVNKPVTKESIDERYANSEVVFTAELVYLRGEKYLLRVTEVFKGEVKIDMLLKGDNANQGECGPRIHDQGPFLIYGKLEDRTILPNTCGYSRSISEPYRSTPHMLPPLPMSVEGDEPTQEEIERHRREEAKRKLEAEKKAIEDIKFELEYLASLKTTEE